MSYPPPADGKPTSFKTNVNRAKTKRWVEAKSYSYDGDDWGEVDDYDEYGGYDEPVAQAQAQAPLKPTGLRQQGQSATQSAQAPRDAPNESQFGHSENTRHGLGHVAGTSSAQQNYGARSATNPQFQINTNLARSNSFARGDERRAFSGPDPYQNLSDNRDFEAAPQQYVNDPASQQGRYQPPLQQLPHHNHPSQQMFTQFSPHQQGTSQLPRSSQTVTGDQQLQTPTQIDYIQQAQMFPEPGRPPFQQGRFDNEEGSEMMGDYRGVSHADQTLHSGLDSKTQTIASDGSLPDLNSHDFPPSVVPPPLQTQNSPSPQRSSDLHSSSQFPPRKSSLSQENQSNVSSEHQSGLSSAVPSDNVPFSRDRTNSNASNKPLPFVRPADIYKRMQEEKERARKSQDSPRPSTEGVMKTPREEVEYTSPTHPGSLSNMDSQEQVSSGGEDINTMNDWESSQNSRPALYSVIERKSKYGTDGYLINDYRADADGAIPLPNKPRETLRPVLPDVARMSGFGDLFRSAENAIEGQFEPQASNSINSSAQAAAHGPSQGGGETDLQHQPSSGFRSVVHQAFDQVPATPSSTSGSGIGRSTSGGTSVVSPIISRGPSLSTRNLHADDFSMKALTPPLNTEDIASTPRPLSSDSLGTPKQITRKVSPSQSPLPDLGDPIPPPPTFIPGHRRDTSTPSPNNSPARTPALEINRQLRQPQEAELATATPIEPIFPTSIESQPSESMSGNTSRFSPQDGPLFKDNMKLFAGVGTNPHSSMKPFSELNVIDTNLRTSDSAKESPSTPLENSQYSRASSPSKTRVRDLAGKFESSSRPGSAHSTSQTTGSPITGTQKSEGLSQVRPTTDRLESFRPQLPGGWESFMSIAPVSAPTRKDNSVSNEPPGQQVLPTQPNENEAINHATLAAPKAPLGNESLTSNESTESPPKFETETVSSDPFSAVVAAGSALAGAIVAAVGVDSQTELNVEASLDKDHNNDTAENERGTILTQTPAGNNVLQPVASQPSASISTSDEASHKSPTPLLEDSSHTLQPISGTNSAAFSAEETPSRENPSEGIVQHRSQAMLPPLSTDTKPSHYESDRLRREIVKDLSPRGLSEPTTAESESPWQDDSRLSANTDVQAYGHDSMMLPSEYDSYWNEPSSGGEANLGSNIPIQPENVTNFNIDPQVSPTKPLQLNRGHQISDARTMEKTENKLPRPTMQTHQYSWMDEPEEIKSNNQPAKQESPRHFSDRTAAYQSQNLSEVEAISKIREDSTRAADPTQQGLRLVNDNQPNLRTSSLPSIAPKASREESRTEQSSNSIDEVPGVQPAAIYDSAPFSGHFSSGQPSQTSAWYPRPYQTGLPNDEASTTQLVENQKPIVPNKGVWEPQNAAYLGLNAADEKKNVPLPPPPPSVQPRIPAFREILALKTPNERIQAYNEARNQFANLNTGLGHWLAIKANELPEHADVISGLNRPPASGIVSKSTPLKAKIAGLRPGANQSTPQPYYQQYLGASPHTQASDARVGQGSAIRNLPPQGPLSGGNSGKTSGHQVQAKGKDFLHSAGVFGGKANVAAKGLFSKGRIKLRGGGSGDKVTPTTSDIEPLSRGMQPQYQPQHGLPLPDQSTSNVLLSTPNISEVPLSLSRQAPNQPSETYEPTDSAQHLKVSSPHGILPIPDQSVSSSTIRDLQAASTTNSDPTILHTATSKKFYYGGLPVLKGPLSDASSNQTPTQTNLYKTYRNEPAPSSSYSVEQPRSLPEHSSHQDFVSESQRGGSQQASQDTSSNPSHLSRQPRLIEQSYNLTHTKQDPEHPTQQRLSQSSNGTFHTAGSRDQPQTDAGVKNQSVSYNLPQSETQNSVHKDVTEGQGNFLAPPNPTQSRDGAQTPDQPISRPFSFMEVSPDRRSHSKDEIVPRAPSMESNFNHNHSDRPPSPVSPQRSMTRDVSGQHDRVDLSHHDSNQDFLRADDQRGLVDRTRSFSRPFQDPNLREHPAFRQEAPPMQNLDVSTDHYSSQVPHETRLPQQYTPDHQIQEVEPPTVPPSDNKNRSHRGSRSSTFFKNFTNPSRVEKSLSENDPEISHAEPPVKDSIAAETKNKRASMFRSINSQRGSIKEERRTNTHIPAQAQSPTISRDFGSVKQQHQEIDYPTKGASGKVHNKLQRASTSAAVEQSPVKKKRFSVIGSLFGRSKHEKPRPPTQLVQSSASLHNPPSTQRSPEAFDQRSVPTSHPSNQYTSVQEYYARPPEGGYYAPNRSVHHVSGPRTQPAGSTHLKTPEPPAYVQDSSLRQNSVSRSQTTGPAAIRPSMAASKGLRNASYSGSQRSLGSSPGPTQSLQTGQNGVDDYLSSKDWSAPTHASPPRRTWHTISSSAHSFTHTPPSMVSSPGPYFPPQPPYQAFPSQTLDPYFQPPPQRYSTSPYDPNHQRRHSPAPPPPPPKDDWPSNDFPVTNEEYPPHNHSPFQRTPQPNPRPPSLLPLQTSIPSPPSGHRKSQSRAEMRKSRQMEIEHGITTSPLSAGGAGAPMQAVEEIGGENERVRKEGGRKERDDSDEDIVMSSTSYPGMEWHPKEYGAWDGN